MKQNFWKSVLMKDNRGSSVPRRTFWPKFILYPALALGALMMVMALKVGFGPALEGHGWQKSGPAPVFVAFSPDHPQKWDKPLTTLTGDNDDDDDDGDDCPTT
jgi:hypothetical protein